MGRGRTAQSTEHREPRPDYNQLVVFLKGCRKPKLFGCGKGTEPYATGNQPSHHAVGGSLRRKPFSTVPWRPSDPEPGRRSHCRIGAQGDRGARSTNGRCSAGRKRRARNSDARLFRKLIGVTAALGYKGICPALPRSRPEARRRRAGRVRSPAPRWHDRSGDRSANAKFFWHFSVPGDALGGTPMGRSCQHLTSRRTESLSDGQISQRRRSY